MKIFDDIGRSIVGGIARWKNVFMWCGGRWIRWWWDKNKLNVKAGVSWENYLTFNVMSGTNWFIRVCKGEGIRWDGNGDGGRSGLRRE
jgi:hypothetical protein